MLPGKVIVLGEYNEAKKRCLLTLVDASGHRADLMLWEKIAQNAQTISVGACVCFTDMAIKINNNEITAVWSQEDTQFALLGTVSMQAPDKLEDTTRVVVPMAGSRRYQEETVSHFTCSEVHYVCDNGIETDSQMHDAVVVEVTNVYVATVNDPMETVHIQRDAAQETTLRVSMRIADRTGSFAATAWERAALNIYGGDTDVLDMSAVQNLVDRGWSPTFITPYDFRVRIDVNVGASHVSGSSSKKGRATIVAVRAAIQKDVFRSSYLFGDGAVLPTSLSAFVFDSIFEQLTITHQGRPWPLANVVFVEMILTASRKATVRHADDFLLVANYCMDVQREPEEPKNKLARHASSEPTPLDASAVCVASRILDCEVAEGFMYHVIGSDVCYNSDTQTFCMTIVKSQCISPDDADILKVRFAKASAPNADPEMQKGLDEALGTPTKVYSVLKAMSPSSGPWQV